MSSASRLWFIGIGTLLFFITIGAIWLGIAIWSEPILLTFLTMSGGSFIIYFGIFVVLMTDVLFVASLLHAKNAAEFKKSGYRQKRGGF